MFNFTLEFTLLLSDFKYSRDFNWISASTPVNYTDRGEKNFQDYGFYKTASIDFKSQIWWVHICPLLWSFPPAFGFETGGNSILETINHWSFGYFSICFKILIKFIYLGSYLFFSSSSSLRRAILYMFFSILFLLNLSINFLFILFNFWVVYLGAI